MNYRHKILYKILANHIQKHIKKYIVTTWDLSQEFKSGSIFKKQYKAPHDKNTLGIEGNFLT